MAKPTGVITPQQAKDLDTEFNSRHTLISTQIVKRPDNRSAWWSLQDIRDYLDYAENQALDDGYTMDGIRVYLGAYPEDSEGVGYTTVFMVPTGNQTGQQAAKGGGSPDLPNGSGLNFGNNGQPPESNYPQ
ncbi:hypothetical protein [Winogradskyella sp. 3972H.M.0a.05]|uniref:hypothetical protein n=1 Tax=Winogradskyella sp. 3972H.M.0a.05 TaxID=2950277 RepID=UPI00339506C2